MFKKRILIYLLSFVLTFFVFSNVYSQRSIQAEIIYLDDDQPLELSGTATLVSSVRWDSTSYPTNT